jgi:hypothetical protein
LSSCGILKAVKKYHYTIQLWNGGGALHTHAKAQSEWSREGLLTQMEETRIAFQEHIGGEVSNEHAQMYIKLFAVMVTMESHVENRLTGPVQSCLQEFYEGTK